MVAQEIRSRTQAADAQLLMFTASPLLLVLENHHGQSFWQIQSLKNLGFKPMDLLQLAPSVGEKSMF